MKSEYQRLTHNLISYCEKETDFFIQKLGEHNSSSREELIQKTWKKNIVTMEERLCSLKIRWSSKRKKIKRLVSSYSKRILLKDRVFLENLNVDLRAIVEPILERTSREDILNYESSLRKSHCIKRNLEIESAIDLYSFQDSLKKVLEMFDTISRESLANYRWKLDCNDVLHKGDLEKNDARFLQSLEVGCMRESEREVLILAHATYRSTLSRTYLARKREMEDQMYADTVLRNVEILNGQTIYTQSEEE